MPTRKLRVFYVDSEGKRTPHVLEVDDQLTVINEYDEEPGAPARPRPSPSQGATGDRTRTAVARWASQSIEENPIPGTDALRDSFFDEHKRLLEKHAKADTKCPPCDISRLIRKYRAILENDGYLKQIT